MTNLWSRVRRRKLVQWTLAYLAGAWLVLQLLDVLTDRLGWPDVIFRVALVALAAGSLGAFVLAWYHGERGAQRVSTTEIVMLAGILVIAGTGVALVAGRGGGDDDTRRPPTRAEADDERPSLAVLPFENMSGNEEDRYFSDGLHEELLTRISRIRGVDLRSRTSVLSYRDTQKNARDIAAELGVAHLVEASVRRAGDRIRVTVQLIDARTDAHLWSETYDRELAADAIFEIQADVAEQIATALGTALSPAEALLVASRPTESVEAYDLYLRGWNSYRRGTSEPDVRAAQTLFEQAVAADPAFTAAWARLAQSRFRLRWFAYDVTEESLRIGEDALARAQALEPGSLEVLTAEGYYHYWGRRDYESALRSLERVVDLDPDNAEARASIGYVLRRQGRLQEAVEQLEEATILDPRWANLLYEYSSTLRGLGRFEEAWAASDRALALEPSSAPARRDRVRLARAQGDFARAREELQASEDMGLNAPEIQFEWVHFLLSMGEGAEAFERIRALPGSEHDAQDMYRPKSLLEAFAHTLLGDAEAARRSFGAARSELDEQIREAPEDWRLWSALGLAHAGLRRDDEALRASDRALEILPLEADLWSPNRSEDRAITLVMVGDHEAAVRAVEDMLSRTGAGRVTPARLRVEAWWEPLRNRADFQALLARYGG